MRYVIGASALSSESPARAAEPAVAEVADLFAAIGETFKHFDAQICAAERELEVLRILRGLRGVADRSALGSPLNDNQGQSALRRTSGGPAQG